MDAGIGARPGGADRYAWGCATTPMTDDSCDAAPNSPCRTWPDPADIRRSANDERLALVKFPDNDAGRAEIVAYIQTWLGKIRAQLPRAFRTLVKGNVEVKRLPLAEEPGAPAAYGGAGAIDGSTPGRMWINSNLHSNIRPT